MAVLQKMECPHRLEPHQISVQTMDCASIFPVVQWLVKKSIETRQLMGEYMRNYAVGQFNKTHTLAQVNYRHAFSLIVGLKLELSECAD